ncbi:hypothetical protein AVEN_221072-1, partial [Araneus ventricosus]
MLPRHCGGLGIWGKIGHPYIIAFDDPEKK